MGKNLTQDFMRAVRYFADGSADYSDLLEMMPQEIRQRKSLFDGRNDEWFSITQLFEDWCRLLVDTLPIEDDDIEKIDEMADIFESADDGMSENEKRKLINQLMLYVNK